jgi:hypothetical protein
MHYDMKTREGVTGKVELADNNALTAIVDFIRNYSFLDTRIMEYILCWDSCSSCIIWAYVNGTNEDKHIFKTVRVLKHKRNGLGMQTHVPLV